MRIRLEDNFEDVLGKALKGKGFHFSELSAESGQPNEAVRRVLDGHFEEQTTRALAEVLDLHPPSLIELACGDWYPAPVHLDGLAIFNTPHPVPGYEEMTVNSYLAWDSRSRAAVAFDSGADAGDMITAIDDMGLTLEMILITHTHADHVKALPSLLKATGHPPCWVNSRESLRGTRSFDAGQSFTVGGLRIETRLTSGHSPGGTTYVISGLGRPVAIVGDSLFCCSQGGAPHNYAEALTHNREQIFSLADDTVLCPGHGPMTSVGEEKVHNPFFPEFKKS